MKNSFILIPTAATSLFLRYLLKHNLYEKYFEGVMSNDYNNLERNFEKYHPILTPTEFVNSAFPWENVPLAANSWSTISKKWNDYYRDKEKIILKHLKVNF